MKQALTVKHIQPNAPQAAAGRSPRRLFNLAFIFLIFSILLFVCQLINLGTFQARARTEDSLPVSIRAESQADYSADRQAPTVPAIDESILWQIIRDIPATGDPRLRLQTMQAALLSPVPTMTPNGQSQPTPTPPDDSTDKDTSPASPSPRMTFAVPTRSLSFAPTLGYVYPTQTAVGYSPTRAPKKRNHTPTATFQVSPTGGPTLTGTATATQASSPTFTATASPTDTSTPTQSATATPTSTATATATATETTTSTPLPTETPAFTPTPTDTPTLPPTSTNTATLTPSPTVPPTSTSTPTNTVTLTPTATVIVPVCYPGTPNGFLPTDDTYIGPTVLAASGLTSTFHIRPDNNADNRGLLKFDLSSIPTNATIQSANLYLYEQGSVPGQRTHIYRVTSDWNEITATWLTFSLLGGDFDSSTSYFTYEPSQDNCMLTLDLKSLVQSWAEGTYPNYGLMLYSTGPSGTITYASKENGTAAFRPKLDIFYTVPSTPTSTATNTSIPTTTASNTPTSTLTNTATHTATFSPTPTETPTLPPTLTETATLTPTHTATYTPTITPSPTETLTATHTPTLIPTPLATSTDTPTLTPTYTASPTGTHTPTLTPTETVTATASFTATFTASATDTLSPTFTATVSYTPSPTATLTPTFTFTPTHTLTPSLTPTPGLPVCYAGTPNGVLPSDDSYIDGGSPTKNYGADNTFDVRPDNGGDRRGLLKFDLSSIPSDATITSATLYLYERGNKTGQTTYIFRVTSGWSESTVTWNSWSSPGGDFDGSNAFFSYRPEQSNCMLTIDLTNLVRAWINGMYSNHGILLYSTGPNHIIQYSSKEDGTIGERPRLDVVYSVATGTP